MVSRHIFLATLAQATAVWPRSEIAIWPVRPPSSAMLSRSGSTSTSILLRKKLATEATALLHGREAADRAAETARQAFEQGVTAEGLPTVALDLASGVNILDAAVAAGFASSRGEARRAIQGGGIKVNDVTVSDERMVLSRAQLGSQGAIKLSFGRKKHVLIQER